MIILPTIMSAHPSNNGYTDIIPETWLDRLLPGWVHPYARLARWDRPIGFWLLFLPCLVGTIFASSGWPDISLIALFAVGAFAMRGAGCTINDMADRDFDRMVERTAIRPLASGVLSMRQAWMFLAIQLGVGLIVLLQFNLFAIMLGLAAIPLVAFYPFAKRFTDWPQAVLGLTFNWGALMGWAAIYGDLSWAAVCLYGGCFFWTVGYDTIYAHQDKEDDAVVGVRSTALLFGAHSGFWVSGFYAAAFALWIGAGWLTHSGALFYVGMLAVAMHFFWQVRSVNFDDQKNCLAMFKSNKVAGLLFSVTLLTDRVFT